MIKTLFEHGGEQLTWEAYKAAGLEANGRLEVVDDPEKEEPDYLAWDRQTVQ
jgi:hypothetical protein